MTPYLTQDNRGAGSGPDESPTFYATSMILRHIMTIFFVKSFKQHTNDFI